MKTMNVILKINEIVMEKIKIAYLDWSYIFAGAERVLYTIIDNLDRCQFEPYLIFPFPRDYQKNMRNLIVIKFFLLLN